MLGQRLPNLGQPLPKYWATGAQELGNGCPTMSIPLVLPLVLLLVLSLVFPLVSR